MTLRELEDAVLEHFNWDTQTAKSSPRLRIRRDLNQWHRRILTMPGLERLRQTTTTFTSVASQAEYTVPDAVARVIRVSDLTNDLVLRQQSMDWYRKFYTDQPTGLATDWVALGERVISTQPSATGIWAVSSSASDITPIVTVEGMTTGGVQWSASATLTGTTRVALGTATTVEQITKLVVNTPCVGTVTLYNAAAAGTALGSIPTGKQTARYLAVLLVPSPSAAQSYTIEYERQIQDLALAEEEPWLPQDFHYLLELGARISEYEKQNDSRQSKAETHLSVGIRQLVGWVNRTTRVYIPGEQQTQGTSRLGPWYPAGT